MLSVDGHHFYVIFMDAFTKFTWIYPLANKSDVLVIFQNFKSLVENLFSSKIKNFQSDWGSKYRSLSHFLTTCGINHCLTCPHTSEQNGTTERKHRHVVETGLLF